MDEEDLYDEFGNYIGPEIMSDSDADQDQDAEPQEHSRTQQQTQVIHSSNEHQIVLHEDKKYYPQH